MAFPEKVTVDAWRAAWTGKFVRVKADAAPELARVRGRVGRVVTVSYSGRAVVDFADGPWTDVAGFEAVLEEVTDEAERKGYDATVNSAQARPPRMG